MSSHSIMDSGKVTNWSVEWTSDTDDGKTATFKVNGVAYNLAKGAFFIIRSEGEQLEVVQLERDLPDAQGAAPKSRGISEG